MRGDCNKCGYKQRLKNNMCCAAVHVGTNIEVCVCNRSGLYEEGNKWTVDIMSEID
jgi:hypothetical protein